MLLGSVQLQIYKLLSGFSKLISKMLSGFRTTLELIMSQFLTQKLALHIIALVAWSLAGQVTIGKTPIVLRVRLHPSRLAGRPPSRDARN
jgi:hypothetical protein